MNQYMYNGPVMEFDICVNRYWKSITKAVSEGKARSNLTYQWKKLNHLSPSAKITLPGKILLVRREEEHVDGGLQTEFA